MNPDEVVAIGAAIQAAVISKEKPEAIKNIVLLDVCPLALGIETIGDHMTPVVKKNT